MNQHDFVKECLAFYEEEGLTPEKGWDKAHYPAPENQGDETIWLSHDHHQIQGLLQSREYGQCCFFLGDVKRFLTLGPFVSGWFELWDTYDEYSCENGKKGGARGGAKAAELGVGVHGRSAEQMAEDGRKGGTKSAELGLGFLASGKASEGGKKAAELGVGVHGRSAEQMAEDGRKGSKNQPREAKSGGGKTTGSQKWQSTDPNHPPHVSSPGPLSRWQRARGIDTSMRVKLN